MKKALDYLKEHRIDFIEHKDIEQIELTGMVMTVQIQDLLEMGYLLYQPNSGNLHLYVIIDN